MKKRKTIDILFVIYILVLLRITVFRSNIGTRELFSSEINLVPIVNVISTFKNNPVLFIYLFFGKVIWFIPIGIYLRKIRNCKLTATIVFGVCLSLFIEIMQYIFGTGVIEIDDLILNTIGVLLGICAVFLFDKIKCKIKIPFKGSRRFETATNILCTVTLTAVLIAVLGIISLMVIIVCLECPFWGLNKIFYTKRNLLLLLVTVFLTLNIAGLIVFKYRLNKMWKYPLFLIASSLVILLCGLGILDGGYRYYSHFTTQKWLANPDCRHLMIDSLESKYKILGMPKREITDILGSPTHINQQTGCYEYYIDPGFIDVLTYDIYFENDIAVKTQKTEH